MTFGAVMAGGPAFANATPVALLSSTPTAADLAHLGAVMLECEQTVCDVRHHFAPGLYAREMRIPAGTVVDGALHLTDHLASCAGDITVWTEGAEHRFTGHHVVESIRGAKRVGMAHTDTVWVTYHANPDDCRDVAELERRLVAQPEQLQYRRLALEAA